MQFISILFFSSVVAVISVAIARLGLSLTLSLAGQPMPSTLTDNSARLSSPSETSTSHG
jgi:hypothetical protein